MLIILNYLCFNKKCLIYIQDEIEETYKGIATGIKEGYIKPIIDKVYQFHEVNFV